MAVLTSALLCLALNVYHEARSESIKGQKAVAVVTMNRAQHDPDKVCAAVFKPKQFSWTNGLPSVNGTPKSKRQYAVAHKPKPTDRAWVTALSVAKAALKGTAGAIVGKVITKDTTHYHASYVSPKWASSAQFTLVAVVGEHLFYRRTVDKPKPKPKQTT